MREWRKVLTVLACPPPVVAEERSYQLFLGGSEPDVYRLGLQLLAVYIAEVYHDNLEPEDAVQKAKRVLRAQGAGFGFYAWRCR